MQRQGGGSCWRAGGELVNGPCAPVRGGGGVPDGCVSGQCGLSNMTGGGCGCGTGIVPKLFGGRRRATRRNRKQTRKNRRCWSRKNRKNTRRAH
jgi:hypothetical protein